MLLLIGYTLISFNASTHRSQLQVSCLLCPSSFEHRKYTIQLEMSVFESSVYAQRALIATY